MIFNRFVRAEHLMDLLRKKRLLGPIVIILLGVFVVSCAVNPVTGTRQIMLLSEADEIRLGSATDTEVIRAFGIYKDTQLADYIQDLGERLASVSHRPDLSYTFRVLDDPVVNAFAVPGGYVYLTRGILAQMNSEAELAGIMAHEIGHITARHSAEQYTKSQLAGLGIGVASIFSESFAQLAGLAQAGLGLLLLKFSRDDERQADDLGVAYASQSGYEGDRMAEFFTAMKRQSPRSDESSLPGWLSTHPDPPDRVEAIRRTASEWRQKVASQELQVGRNRYLTTIDGLVYGDDPRRGYVKDQVYYHPELQFQFPAPAQWKLTNTPRQVRMINGSREAAILFQQTQGAPPKEAALRFVRSNRPRVLQADALSVNGMPAQRLVSDIYAQQRPLRVLSYFIEMDRRIFMFHGFCPTRLFRGYAGLFQSVMEGFQRLTDPARLQATPDRIGIVSVGTPNTLEQFLLARGYGADLRREIAGLNNMDLDTPLSEGTLVKVVNKGHQP